MQTPIKDYFKCWLSERFSEKEVCEFKHNFFNNLICILYAFYKTKNHLKMNSDDFLDLGNYKIYTINKLAISTDCCVVNGSS